MRLMRWTVLGLSFIFLGCGVQNTTSQQQSPTMVPRTELDGTWEILSVYRDGEFDPVQVGAKLIFANGEVKFEPNERQINLSDFSR
jgi:hypothetical protein